MRNIAVFLATLGGLGRIRWAPGTWGSLVGLLGGFVSEWWTLPWLGWPLWLVWVVVGAKFVLCALICTVAERALGIHDAPAIILDEAWAMAAIVVVVPETAFSLRWSILALLLFRLFDIVKPFPLKHLARLPGGWGIMADDLGAAVYAVLILWCTTSILNFRF